MSSRLRAPRPLGPTSQQISRVADQSINQSTSRSSPKPTEQLNQLQTRKSQSRSSSSINQSNPDWGWLNTDIPPQYRAPINQSINQSIEQSPTHFSQSLWRECGFELEQDRYFVTSFVAFHAARSINQPQSINQSTNANLLSQAEEWSRLTSGMSQFDAEIEAASVNQFEKQIKLTHSWATQLNDLHGMADMKRMKMLDDPEARAELKRQVAALVKNRTLQANGKH